MSEIETGEAPRWFMPAAIAVLLFEALGCFMCASQLSVDPALLEPDQRLLWEAAPGWMLVAYVVAVTVGLVGAVQLLRRRRSAEPLLLVSFVAVIVQFSALLAVPAMRNLIGSDDLFLPFVIILCAYGAWHLARIARQRGWLA